MFYKEAALKCLPLWKKVLVRMNQDRSSPRQYGNCNISQPKASEVTSKRTKEKAEQTCFEVQTGARDRGLAKAHINRISLSPGK